MGCMKKGILSGEQKGPNQCIRARGYRLEALNRRILLGSLRACGKKNSQKSFNQSWWQGSLSCCLAHMPALSPGSELHTSRLWRHVTGSFVGVESGSISFEEDIPSFP